MPSPADILIPGRSGPGFEFSAFNQYIATNAVSQVNTSFPFSRAGCFTVRPTLVAAPGANRIILPFAIVIGVDGQTIAGGAGPTWTVEYGSPGMTGFSLFTAVTADCNNVRQKVSTAIAPTQNLWTLKATRWPVNSSVTIGLSADPGATMDGMVRVSMLYYNCPMQA